MMVRPLSSMVAVLPVCDSVVSASFLREDWLHILGVDTARMTHNYRFVSDMPLCTSYRMF